MFLAYHIPMPLWLVKAALTDAATVMAWVQPLMVASFAVAGAVCYQKERGAGAAAGTKAQQVEVAPAP